MKLFLAALSLSLASATKGKGSKGKSWRNDDHDRHSSAAQLGLQRTRSPNFRQLGPRPFWMVEQMEDSPLKEQLAKCIHNTRNFMASDFSIGHRGACMQFPEHTKESYEAAALMGAGVIECDVTFTKDLELVCRHAQCDLHTTTNILNTTLASKCTEGFVPADPDNGTTASAKCCTSDLTLEEFMTLKGKMDAANTNALTVQEYLGGTPNWRTDLYTPQGTLLTHKESIELIASLGAKFTPELKSPEVEMPFQGFSQEDYASKMLNEYLELGIKPSKVWPQSFNDFDIYFWIRKYPQFAKRAVFLDGRYDQNVTDQKEIAAKGVNVLAPPMQILLKVDDKSGKIVPSDYAIRAKEAGLNIITWTVERSGLISAGNPGFYYSTIEKAITNEGDLLEILHVLDQEVGILGVFSDWPATTTFYANCIKKNGRGA